MEKFFLTLIAIIFFSTEIIYGQTEFINGYIIKNNNDTIYGLIGNRGGIGNCKTCLFKEDAVSDVTEFTPDEIKAYRFIHGKYYVSTQLETDELSCSCFLEFLINGIVDIYYYADQSGWHYFIDKGDGIFLELKNDKKVITINNTEYINESKEYIGLLKYIFQDSPSVIKEADNVSLNSKSLIKITKDYHESVCTDGECIIYEKKIPKLKPKLEFGVLTGITIFNKNIINRDVKYLYSGTLETEHTPSIGFILKLSIPNLSKNFSMEYSGTFNKSNSTLHGSYFEPVFSTTNTNDISLKNNSLNNSLRLAYEYAKGKIRPTLKIGGFYNFLTTTDYTHIYNSTWLQGAPYQHLEDHDNIFPERNYGVSFGVGINLKLTANYKIFMDLTYQHSDEVTDSVYNKSGAVINRTYKNLKSDRVLIELGFLWGK